MVEKSLVPTSVFDANPFQAGWAANGGEVTEASSTAVSNPNAGNDACVPQDNSSLIINSTLDIQQFLSNNGFNPGPIDGQSGPKTKMQLFPSKKKWTFNRWNCWNKTKDCNESIYRL